MGPLKRRALITGITGQDGSYLAEFLLQRGYSVYGLVRRTSTAGLGRASHLADRLELLDGDVTDLSSLVRAVAASRPDEVYHLAAMSFVGRSWNEPLHAIDVTGLGAVRMIEAIRIAWPEARLYQASSSEMYGAQAGRVGVDGPFRPRSPYGNAKLLAHNAAINAREAHGLFVCAGILFNHESPRRGPHFVTAKVADGAARASLGDHTPLRLGNLDARRDWGWAPDYVAAMHALLTRDAPIDVVVATGVSHSVGDLCRVAYGSVGLDWRNHVVADPALLRPADIDALVGDPEPARALIGWAPTVGFDALVDRMVAAAVSRLR